MNLPENPDQAVRSVEQDHAEIAEYLASDEWQRRLEEARAQREKVSAVQQSTQAASRRESDDIQPEGYHPQKLPGATAFITAGNSPNYDAPQLSLEGTTGSIPARVERLQSRVWSLLIGLICGIALSAGLMRFAGHEASFSWRATGGSESLEAAANPSQWLPSTLSEHHSRENVSFAAGNLQPETRFRSTSTPFVPTSPDKLPFVHNVSEAPEAFANPSQWLPSTLSEHDSVENVSFATGNLQLGTRFRLTPTPFVPTSPDKLPFVDNELRIANVPLEVSTVVQTTASMLMDARPQVALHLSPGLSQAAIERARLALTNAGVDLESSGPAVFGVLQSQVLYFHQEDATDAALIAEAIGATVRDFSEYTPTPERGWLEVWLAEEG
jgi:hypothetical protein